MAQILYAHLCEKAFLSQNGNLNIIGIFEEVRAPQFPLTFPQLSFVATFRGKPHDHQIVIKIVNTADEKEITKPIEINMKAPENQQETDKEATVRLIGDINNLQIASEGKYEVRITLDGKEAYTVPFSASKASKPIPQGR